MALGKNTMKVAMKIAVGLSKIGIPFHKASSWTLKAAWKIIGGKK
jgi:hypothetical protein